MGEDGFRLEYEKNEEDGSLVFKLRDDVRAAIKAESPSKVRVTMWRGDDVDTFVHPDTGNINTANFRRRLAKAAGRMFGKTYDADTDMGKKRIKLLEDDLGRVAAALEQKPEGEDDKLREVLDLLSGGPGPAEVLLKLAQVGEYFHDPDGEAYSTIPVEGHRETVPLKGRDFKRWLRHLYYEDQKGAGDPEPSPLRSQVVTDVVNQLEAKAMFDGLEHPVHVRVAERDGTVYIDLCDERWRVVEIDKSGWRPISDPPVKFVRAKGMAPMPIPTRSQDGAAILRGLLNLGDDEDGDQAWRLILAWLTKALRARGPYPVLLLLGGQGTAKSTAGGDHDLFIWTDALRDVVCNSSLCAGASPEPEDHPSRRREGSTYRPTHADNRERIPYPDGADFVAGIREALRMAEELGTFHMYGSLLALLADCEPMARYAHQQERGASYKQLAACAHTCGMTKEERIGWYRLAEGIPLADRHASHLLGALKRAAA